MKLLKRFSIAILFALLVTAATYMIAQGRTEITQAVQQPAQQQTNPCFGCHSDFRDAWQSGSHGHASSDPLFTQMWTDQGKPGACLVCHVTGYDRPDTTVC